MPMQFLPIFRVSMTLTHVNCFTNHFIHSVFPIHAALALIFGMTKKDGVDSRKRAKDRTRVTLSLPTELVEKFKLIAKDKHYGDMTHAFMTELHRAGHEEVAEFLRKHGPWKKKS